jgi:rhodanese-related sulfurtransferase
MPWPIQAGSREKGLLSGAALILVLSLACGTVANWVSPARIPWIGDWENYIETKALKDKITLVTAAQAKALFDQGTHLFLDARPKADYDAGRIPTALSLPYTQVDEGMIHVQQYLTPTQPIVTYCSGKDCDESFMLTKYLRLQGFTNIVLFAGGMEQWKSAGYAVEGGAP